MAVKRKTTKKTARKKTAAKKSRKKIGSLGLFATAAKNKAYIAAKKRAKEAVKKAAKAWKDALKKAK
jgi:hypothetical protein